MIDKTWRVKVTVNPAQEGWRKESFEFSEVRRIWIDSGFAYIQRNGTNTGTIYPGDLHAAYNMAKVFSIEVLPEEKE